MTSLRRRIRGQGITEYIIVVALIVIGAIGVYIAFGDVFRGQTIRAAAAPAASPAPRQKPPQLRAARTPRRVPTLATSVTSMQIDV